MGNVLSFNSPDLQGAVTSPGAADPSAVIATSYAFGTDDGSAFGITATLTVSGTPTAAPAAVTPTITAPARAGGLDLIYTCNPFPPGVTASSIICPGALNQNFGVGTATIDLFGGEDDDEPLSYYTARYLFSLTTLSTANGGAGEATTVTVTSTSTITSDATTTTVPGSLCPGPTANPTSARPTGSVRPSGSVSPSGSMRPSGSIISSVSGLPSGSVRPSGSIRPSGSVGPTGKSTASIKPSASGSISSSMRPSGSIVASISSKPSHSGSPSNSSKQPSGGPNSRPSSGLPSGASKTTLSGTNYGSSQNPSATSGTGSPASSGGNVGSSKSYGGPRTYSTIMPTSALYPSPDGFVTITLVETSTTYVCPTPTPPPTCSDSTAPAMQKRDAGFEGPRYTLSNGDSPTVNGGGADMTVTSTFYTGTTVYSSTITQTAACTTAVPLARRGPLRARQEMGYW